MTEGRRTNGSTPILLDQQGSVTLLADVRHSNFAATINVNAIQKCHRLRKVEMSPKALTVARLSDPETSYIAGLMSLAGVVHSAAFDAISACALALLASLEFQPSLRRPVGS